MRWYDVSRMSTLTLASTSVPPIRTRADPFDCAETGAFNSETWQLRAKENVAKVTLNRYVDRMKFVFFLIQPQNTLPGAFELITSWSQREAEVGYRIHFSRILRTSRFPSALNFTRH